MSFARGFMRWLAPIGGASQDPRVVRDTPTASRFRVEPLEPRLLLSGDPLDLVKGSLERQLLQEPAVSVSDTASAPSPSIDWGGGVMTKGDDPHDVLPAEQPTAPLPIAPATPQPTMPVEAAPVQNTDARTSTPTSSASTLTVDTAHGFVSSTNPATSQMSDTHDARGPPVSVFTDEEASLLSVGSADARGLLRDDDVLPVVGVALSRWLASNQSDAVMNRLDQLSFRIVYLPGRMLGRTSGTTIQLDPTAAGYRWLGDPSPSSNDEFEPTDTEMLFAAQPGSPARGRMDLLTVVEHEIGHVLGFHHDDPIAPMADVLAPGRRILLPAGSIPDGSTELAAAPVDDADSAPPVLDLSDETGNLTIILAPEGDVIVSGAVVDSDHNSIFGGVDGIVSGSGDDTLVGPGLTNLWAITGSNAGTLAAGSLTPLTFTGVENLRGGDGSDTFAMTADGRLSGVVDGGRGNDTLVGADTPNTWVIDGTDSGKLNGQSFAGIESLTGGAAADTFIWTTGGSLSGVVSGGLGDDTLVGADTPNTWTLTGVGAGTLNGQSFTGIENLVGGEDSDRFVFAGGSVTGRIDGRGGVNTLDYSSDTLGVTVDLTATVATGASSISGIGAVVGGSGVDTLVGPASSNMWTISETDTGAVNFVAFRSIENLVGGAESDIFIFEPAAKISGQISGGAGDDTVVGPDTPNTWIITDPDAGTLNGVAFSEVENAQGGGGEDLFMVAAAGLLSGALLGGPGDDRLREPNRRNIWRISGRNAGQLNDQRFTDIENLVGGADDDEFALEDGASVDGVIEGGEGIDWLDYSAYATDIATDPTTGDATGTAGISGIEQVIGPEIVGDMAGDDTATTPEATVPAESTTLVDAETQTATVTTSSTTVDDDQQVVALTDDATPQVSDDPDARGPPVPESFVDSEPARFSTVIDLTANTSSLAPGNLVIDASTILMGNGTIDGDVFVAGVLSPGNSPGKVTINGNLKIADGNPRVINDSYTPPTGSDTVGTLAIEIGGVTPGTQHDQVIVIGNVELGGTLKISLINGFVPSPGQTFEIVKFGSATGWFKTIEGVNMSGIRLRPFLGTSSVILKATNLADLFEVRSTLDQVTVTGATILTHDLVASNAGDDLLPLAQAISTQIKNATSNKPVWLLDYDVPAAGAIGGFDLATSVLPTAPKQSGHVILVFDWAFDAAQ